MATLIGCGSHARDIRFTDAARITRQVAHHSLWDQQGEVIIGVNDPFLRARIAKELGVRDRSWVHPHTWFMEGSYGHGTHINYGVTMTRTRIGHHCTISPGVTICGDVTIGDRVLIGAGATICDRVTIGDDVTIGAGCVVLPESVVDSGATIVGVPAKHLATGVHVK
jgi:carbonic anhydrase/acetyltransferase-like protein (isoleucine patch superfamily)